jgi:hypothetical protein
MAIGTDVETAGIAERRHEQKNLCRNRTDLHPAFAEVDLQLFAGCVSNRTVARAAAINSRSSGATARSTVRRLTMMFFSRASSWRTTSALRRGDESVRAAAACGRGPPVRQLRRRPRCRLMRVDWVTAKVGVGAPRTRAASGP